MSKWLDQNRSRKDLSESGPASETAGQFFEEIEQGFVAGVRSPSD
jgi:hypothetical protein